jgi:hypothetical protein
MSTPCSWASFFATGEILMRSAMPAPAEGAAGVGARPVSALAAATASLGAPGTRPAGLGAALGSRLSAPESAAGGTATSSGVTSSPGCPRMPIRPPTGSSTPSLATSLRRVPAAEASTSYSTFSVWISTTGCPFSILSPSAFNHCRIVPFSMVSPNWGISMRVAIQPPKGIQAADVGGNVAATGRAVWTGSRCWKTP